MTGVRRHVGEQAQLRIRARLGPGMPADDRNVLRLCLSQLSLLAGGVEPAQDDPCRPQAQRSAERRSLSGDGPLAVEDPKRPADRTRRLLGASCHTGDTAVRQIGGDEHDQAWTLSGWSVQRAAIGPSRVQRVSDHGPRPLEGRTRRVPCRSLAAVSGRGDHHGGQEHTHHDPDLAWTPRVRHGCGCAIRSPGAPPRASGWTLT